ncbi:pectinesterase inhibitor 1 [Cajanus cajan]|uniref:Pectinesterase inhibitor 1 n=1 Tax=Cajanus cajan TaxID=3821 RepID=A0A151SPC0_CAJCA|nr:pectinesterase inhibitor 1 [Cajanus cajan]KYP56601.1 Pectinesterase inhibitor 1 [Cajanus cajan]
MHSNFSSLVLVFILFFPSTSYAIPVSKVNAICKQTKNPSFCFTLLNSHPNANLVTLTQYTINIARANVTNTIILIKQLIAHSAKDPKGRSHYTSCLEHFGSEGALGDVEYTQELLKKRDYAGVNTAASAILTDVDDCISGESPSDPRYHDPSKLPQYAAVLGLVVEIILVLSNFLVH